VGGANGQDNEAPASGERARAKRRPHRVFVSYSHVDHKWLERLLVHLKPLERGGLVERWDDTRLRTGDLWRMDIEKALAQADIAILLLSADYLASDFIYKQELLPLLAAHEERGLVVMPVIISSCYYQGIPSLEQFMAVNPELQPLNAMTKGERETVWARLVEHIVQCIYGTEIPG
jgi:hypothetical protein